MATEKRKIHRVIDTAGTLVQVLPETSAEQVTLADAAGNFTSNNVEGALAEVAEIAKTGGVTGVKGDAETTYRKGNVNITKANIGLGNVDNTADANKSVKHATSADSATTATSATTAGSATKATQDASGNVITSTYATKTELQEVAAGKKNTFTYDDYQKFVSATNALGSTAMSVGDNVLIKTLNVPDMWVTRVNAVSTSYTYVDDQSIVNALNTTNGLTVGYFTFSQLETTKVDLTDYQTKTDNSLNTTSKTIVGAINEVKTTADSAASKAITNATAITNITNGTTIVGEAKKVQNKLQIRTKLTGSPVNAGAYDGSAVRNVDFDGSFMLESTADTTTIGLVAAPKVGKALTLTGSSSQGTQQSVDYDGSKSFHLAFYEEDFIFPPNPTTGFGMVTLGYTGVEKGQYSAVNVDTKGRVTAGGKSVEWGASGQTTPSDDLMTGGIFWELQ